ncbi:sensor histidine kinase [Acetobacter pomorum]|uniref:histidine kinase n=1 Tax=Acetobacter pomorum TaxID=65959 RepID=A0A2G4RA80_9PROT|nr:HAMP domain-containing sensor histidine kinase [Acetobacter pomorum]PHY93417.1 sensor histidine kinase [Acetobacter pomorum]GBR50624.1 two component sensor histidine kinase [Acetobacter pomorum DSM 11825]
MFLTELFRTATFRITLMALAAMAGVMVMQFGLVYAQLEAVESRRSTELLKGEAELLAQMSPEHLEYVIRRRATDDLRLIINSAGLFDSGHALIAGDLRTWPKGLKADGKPHNVEIYPEEGDSYPLRVLAEKLPDGTILVLGRSFHLLSEQKLMLRHTMLVAAVPTFVFALFLGIVLSHRALSRVKEMHEAIDRIMAGDIHERLPAAKERDDLERLAGSVNRMLDRLERLMDDMREVGNDIAHDLRTPLSRVRARLERALSTPAGSQALEAAVGRAVDDLDQCLGIITALLRIAEIENSRRQAGFGQVLLADLVTDVFDLYEPIAEMEDKVLVAKEGEAPCFVWGDRHLLIELLANLVDNAIKFTPQGGRIILGSQRINGAASLFVMDTGVGIAPAERKAVLSRFYRSDKSRHVPGSGLGLSLVCAIAHLHEAHVTIETGPEGTGTCFRITFPSAFLQKVEDCT